RAAACAAAYAAADAAAADAAADAAYAAAWSEVVADCAWLKNHSTSSGLISEPLRLIDGQGDEGSRANLPPWARMPLDAFAASAKGSSWHLIADWYRAILPSAPDTRPGSLFGEAATVALATQPGEFWTVTDERTPDSIMDDVAGIASIGRVASLSQDPLGNTWSEIQSQFKLAQSGTAEDIEQARTPIVGQLHAGIQRRIRDFAPIARRVEDEHGWENFVASFDRLSDALSGSISDIPGRIGTVYDVAIEFSSYLDQDDDLRKYPKGNVSCLDPERRRAFENLVLAIAPWLRRFPTARSIDDETGNFLGKLPDRLLAIELINAAGEASLISESDRRLLVEILTILRERGHISTKASVRGAHTARNLAIATISLVGSFYLGAVSSSYSGQSEIVEKSGKFLAEKEKLIIELMTDAPSDLKRSLAILLERIGKEPRGLPLKDGAPPTGTPGEVRRRRD
ncbi:hypothetical protein, partial [Aquibium sp. ELW1220]|uniref:hypothetical protein n=1 Tax=Aquibium sp. ELW1220 TaxID=2976766 RepID=UPI0025B1ED36